MRAFIQPLRQYFRVQQTLPTFESKLLTAKNVQHGDHIAFKTPKELSYAWRVSGLVIPGATALQSELIQWRILKNKAQLNGPGWSHLLFTFAKIIILFHGLQTMPDNDIVINTTACLGLVPRYWRYIQSVVTLYFAKSCPVTAYTTILYSRQVSLTHKNLQKKNRRIQVKKKDNDQSVRHG